MKISSTIRLVLGLGTAALLAACSGSGSQSQSGLPSVQPNVSQHAFHPDNQRSWIAPDAKSKDLLYISDYGTGDLDVFTYPGGKAKGKITGLTQPEGVCTDASGNVWATQFSSEEVLEYAHGGVNSIGSVDDPGFDISGCAIDPTTGNLAVANYVGTGTSSFGSPQGGVSIYANAEGSPVEYTDTAVQLVYALGYDAKGDLFIDGQTLSGNFIFAELPAGTVEFNNLSVNANIATPGGVQWDGKHITVGDATGGEIYKLNVAGSTATVVGTTTLKGTNGLYQPYIDGKKIVGSNYNGGDVDFWKYPAGGNDTKKLSGFKDPFGAVVSTQ